jgi:hypothetical protein
MIVAVKRSMRFVRNVSGIRSDVAEMRLLLCYAG